ncbi:Very-short-patch-repair endonuclease [Devosia enhydra]|uniref:Very-short-patch-repair endonuclease n=1 Tax=Devosia enhydra TaxID=665118 RepID=A0A1K2HYF6_9HYPH|nr:Very-short-patch-repair endonuclease [Devosia enhydra]
MSVLKTRFAARAAHALRQNMTDAEHRLWQHLRNRQMLGHKFVRQQPVGPFIVDFACREANLVIELDGGQHADNPADARRTAALAAHGYEVIRFWNSDVLKNPEGVMTVIAARLAQAPSPHLRFARPPSPLPVDAGPSPQALLPPDPTPSPLPSGERSDGPCHPGEGALPHATILLLPPESAQ